MLATALGVSFLPNILAEKEFFQLVKERLEQSGFLMSPYLLTSFEMQKYYQNELKFNCFYSINSLPELKNGSSYIINLDKKRSVGAH